MPLKQEYEALLNNRAFTLIRNEIKEELFEAWCNSTLPEEREDIFSRYQAIIELVGYIEAEAKNGALLEAVE